MNSAAWAQEAAKEVAAAVATGRVLAIIGSGETSPTMVTAHRELIARLGPTSPQAIALATPYAFQENAADISARTQHYFADSVGLQVRVAAGTSPNVALIPHYDNAEGGRYDTRHCYLGERRLAVMERDLPADAAVLGVDEHTAVLVDLRTSDVEIRGRGGMTVRRSGHSVVLPAGTRLSVAEL